MTTTQLFLIYWGIGFIVAIPLGRRYWKQFRQSNHKVNIIVGRFGKLDFNRIIDSFVFMIAWIIFSFTYPLQLFLILIGKEGKI